MIATFKTLKSKYIGFLLSKTFMMVIAKVHRKKKTKKKKKVNSQRISAVSSGVVILSQGSQETIKLTQLRLLSI